ncbi:beta-ketoacyl-ACP synthase III [Proteocatella sphenisci]|uniref:beta-ketoacyl-ACP synthase III n=1 Tax=Proteocatella sphenisci TaxID=181070 RepID=UPI0004B56969|nr:beta-ketoacyl-ACP synthase III [Proteocatella sphenisci]
MSLISTGSYAPKFSLGNDHLTTLVDTSSEWIEKRTGIKKRNISAGENTSDLAYEAGKQAIENSNVNLEDIDLVLVATITPDHFTPSTASMVQGKLGIKNAVAFDISAGCTGFVYALGIASSMIKNGIAKNALVIGSEVLSKVLDYTDRNTCVIFGDGAGALVLTKDLNDKIKDIYLQGEYDTAHNIQIQSVNVNNAMHTSQDASTLPKLSMNGGEVYKFALGALSELIEVILERNNLTNDDIKYIVPHQANFRIIETVAKKLGIDINKFYMNIENYGNTSSASIPIALAEMNNLGLLKKGDKIIIAGFGAGLTWGSILIEW